MRSGHNSTMRNAISYFKQYRSAPLMSTLMAVLLAGGFVVALPRQATPARPTPVILPGRSAPALAKLFTPRTAPAGSYAASVLELPLDRATALVRQRLGQESAPAGADGAWRAVRTAPLDAFGATAPYNKSQLAQLYVALPANVVRAPVAQDGTVIGSVTLISPYPDPTLSRLEPGTLVIYFDAVTARRGISR